MGVLLYGTPDFLWGPTQGYVGLTLACGSKEDSGPPNW